MNINEKMEQIQTEYNQLLQEKQQYMDVISKIEVRLIQLQGQASLINEMQEQESKEVNEDGQAE